MSATVILTVISGSLKGLEFEFSDHITFIIGRGKDCYIRLPDDEIHLNISRHHCLFNINPPLIWVRDLGSKNGTYVNGQKIGQRRSHQSLDYGLEMNLPEYNLTNGDEIAIGQVIFRVSISLDNSNLNLPMIEGYTLLRELGKEGNKIVYLANNHITGQLVALTVRLP